MATTTPPAISGLPAAPDPNNRATFNTLAYPWSAALPAFGDEIAGAAAATYANAIDAQSNALLAVGAAASMSAVAWVSGASYVPGNAVYSPINFSTYRCKATTSGTTDPSLDAVNWASVVPPTVVTGDIIQTVVAQSAPDYLPCDESIYLRSAYPDLAPLMPVAGLYPFWVARSISPLPTIRHISHGNGLFVALPVTNASTIATSPDGITWTNRTVSAATWASVAFGNSVFVLTYQEVNVSLWTSPDGITWTARGGLPNNRRDAVAFGAGVFVALNYNSSTASSSTDGITWTSRTLPSSGQWNALTFANGLFVALVAGSSGIAATSPDGITWTQRTMPSTQAWRSVAGGNGVFVATSDSGETAISTNGITWTSGNMPASGNWCAIAFGDGWFVAVSQSTNKTAFSRDGKTWQIRETPEVKNWNTVAYGNGLFITGDNSSASTATIANRITSATQFSTPAITNGYIKT